MGERPQWIQNGNSAGLQTCAGGVEVMRLQISEGCSPVIGLLVLVNALPGQPIAGGVEVMRLQISEGCSPVIGLLVLVNALPGQPILPPVCT
jgi:hypothetical protein